MSLYIIEKNKVITMTRGDSAKFSFKFMEGKFPNETPLVINDDDIVFFGLMDPNQYFEHALLKKEFSNKDIDEEGNFIITLEPDDTIELMEGTYFYAIKLLTSDAQIKTLVQNTKFNIVN